MDWKLDVEVYNLSVEYVGVHNKQKIVKGCCMELAGFLKRENLDLIMEIMKFSISSTIPKSSLYTNVTMSLSDYLPFFPHARPLMDLLQNG